MQIVYNNRRTFTNLFKTKRCNCKCAWVIFVSVYHLFVVRLLSSFLVGIRDDTSKVDIQPWLAVPLFGGTRWCLYCCVTCRITSISPSLTTMPHWGVLWSMPSSSSSSSSSPLPPSFLINTRPHFGHATHLKRRWCSETEWGKSRVLDMKMLTHLCAMQFHLHRQSIVAIKKCIQWHIQIGFRSVATSSIKGWKPRRERFVGVIDWYSSKERRPTECFTMFTESIWRVFDAIPQYIV